MAVEAEAPHLVDAQVVEDAKCRARRVDQRVEEGGGFGGFLDGVQESHTVCWYEQLFPIVVGTVAAVIRERVDRHLGTWREPIVRRRLYVPFAHVPRALLDGILPDELLVDVSVSGGDAPSASLHPLHVLEETRHAVERDRESAEAELAEAWCASESRALYVDGSISGGEHVARASTAVGVIKSHRTLYASGDALRTIVGLGKGERSSVLRVAPRFRSSVLSWYLRLRDPTGHDALWALVRVEAADSERSLRHADEISRWILAEGAPTAMPDSRWDRMSYGVRNCEEFLRAIR